MHRILIFGGTGSLGKKLIQRFLSKENKRIANVSVFSRDEAKHWSIKNELHAHKNIQNLDFYVGDVRDLSRVKDAIRQARPTTIIIAAALKQVDTCELSPNESVATNIVGTQNIISAVNEIASGPGCLIASVVFVSTDKACAPVNVYGMCKSISERIVTSQAKTGHPHIRYTAVRYGNVLESRGSIIPLFKYQAEHNEFLTVTDPDMTRYVMTLDDSCALIERAMEAHHANSGYTYIPKLRAMRVGDLAEIFSERSGKPIKFIGLRPGEKMHEDLINYSESPRVWEEPEHYAMAPAFKAGNGRAFTYSSADSVMTKAELLEHLTKLGILDAPLEQFKGVSIEEIVTNRKS